MPTPRNKILRWPSWLEPFLVDGYVVNVEDRRQRSEFDIGSQMRVVFSSDESAIDCSLYLDSLGSNWFEGFERDALIQGSHWFYMPLWVGGQMVDHLVRFKTRPQMGTREAQSEYCTYTFQLEVGRRQELMEKGLVEWFIDNNPQDAIKTFERLQPIVNVKYPEALPFPVAA